jgi:hypothetical protein
MGERPVAVKARGRPPSSPLEEFEQVYLRNVDVLMGYFAPGVARAERLRPRHGRRRAGVHAAGGTATCETVPRILIW